MEGRYRYRSREQSLYRTAGSWDGPKYFMTELSTGLSGLSGKRMLLGLSFISWVDGDGAIF